MQLPGPSSAPCRWGSAAGWVAHDVAAVALVQLLPQPELVVAHLRTGQCQYWSVVSLLLALSRAAAAAGPPPGSDCCTKPLSDQAMILHSSHQPPERCSVELFPRFRLCKLYRKLLQPFGP